MRTILVVDDDREMRSLLQAIFTRNAYDVLTADTLAAAETILRDRRVELVICDVFLPDGNAFEFHKRLSSPPLFLFLSGYSEPFLDYAQGARTSFAMKPVNPAYLVTKAADMIESDRRRGGPHECADDAG